jgi:hypothetical protein
VQAQFESQGLSAWRVGRVVDGSGVVLRGPGSAAEDGA